MPFPKSKRVTRKDVARLAGVSTATISYVINNGPRPVAPETRARVLRIIDELGYYPNELARSLRIKQTSTVGLVIPDLRNPFYADLARSLEQICFSRGYVVMVCNTNRETDKERRFAEVLRAKQVDGVVFLPDADSLEALDTLRLACIPMVVLEHDVEGLHCIAIDDLTGGFIGTQHLIQLGHRRIGFIQQRPNHTTSQRRLEGYFAALQAAGLPSDPSLVVTCDPEPAAGAVATRSLLAHVPGITAIFAHNDLIALGAMHAIREAGLSIPGDISVLGYDDNASAAFYAPPLTTISYPKEAMAKVAARQLFQMLEADQDPPPPATELLPVNLIVRHSTAPVG
jgi:LacI family transcriptional regulator